MEYKLVHKEERYHLDLAGLTSTQNSRTERLERGWSFSTLELPWMRGIVKVMYRVYV